MLYRFKTFLLGSTYAAVAAKFSILLPCVTSDKETENTAVNAHTIPSLAVMFLTKERTIIAAMGMSDDSSVPITVAMR